MGQKDLTAKRFESIPEVFADIINAFVYEGEQVISPQNLQPAPTESLYSAKNGVLHNQYNDVSRYEINNGKIVMQYTLENQTNPDYKILLRKAGYEGAVYRQQYDGKDTYPAITLVLYWGDTVWNADSDAVIRMLYALTGETDFIDHVELLQERQEKGEKITMGYALTKYMEQGREQGIQEGKREGIKEGKREGKREGIEEEKMRCAKAFVSETLMQKQSKEYIVGILQTCFQLKEEEAVSLYREGAM